MEEDLDKLFKEIIMTGNLDSMIYIEGVDSNYQGNKGKS